MRLVFIFPRVFGERVRKSTCAAPPFGHPARPGSRRHFSL